jgi:ribosomal protein S18 acetylase RimI-like enzyme
VATLHYRPAVSADAAECVVLRGQTRENAISAATLASLGITAGSWANDIETGRLPGYVCTDDDRIVGYCFGDKHTGEIVVLAVLPQYEGRGIGKALLLQVVEDLRSLGYRRLFLGCSSDPSHRSHGFYRRLGWRPTGSFDVNGDEVLELQWQDAAHGA